MEETNESNPPADFEDSLEKFFDSILGDDNQLESASKLDPDCGGGGVYSYNESPVSGALASALNSINYPSLLSSEGTNKTSTDGGDQKEESSAQMLGDEERENSFEHIYQSPDKGMEFPSEEEAYKFYNNYAREIGFRVRKGKVQRLADRTIRKRFFFCSKQGFKEPRDTKYKRKETRTGCEARIQLTVENEKWKISQVCLEHNHAHESPCQGGKTNSCTKISEADPIVHTVNEAGTVNEERNANREQFHDMDCSNHLRDTIINSLQHEDGQSLLNYLRHLQAEDSSIFYSLQGDAENRITNCFWRDGRSKIDYDYFRDIIILDTTFRMSRYDMICVPFWGVNHHRQYILFGCAFLLDESVDSLNWLLDTFMEAMGRRQPKTIVTDASKVMAKAIEVTLPETQHCLSLQYIRQNAKKHLSTCFEQAGFESLFNKCVFDCQSVEEFKSMWESLLEQHNLRENSWLNRIYMLRDKWSHAFWTFPAGIQSNQGSESINNVFQNVASEIMTLPKFVEQYEVEALRRRRQELHEDFNCNGSAPTLTNSGMEKQAANTYTRTMFKMFQGELLRCLSVAIEEIANDGSTVATFKITEEGEEKGSTVKFNCLDSRVTCSCGKFESIGILCFHALKVLNARNIFRIPPQYVLKRWTKSAKGTLLPTCRLRTCLQRKSIRLQRVWPNSSDVKRHSLSLESDVDEMLSPDNGSASSSTLTNSGMEKQAANTYTRTMFKMFQGELLRCLSVAIEEIANDGSTVATFKITEEGEEKGNLVEFNGLDSRVTCSCGKFESIGILCVHALKVLNARNIFQIPLQYVLKRWTKCAKEGFVEDAYGADREVGVGDGMILTPRHACMPRSVRKPKMVARLRSSITERENSFENGKWVISKHNHDVESSSQGDKTGSNHGLIAEGNLNHELFHDMDCSNYLGDKRINCLQPEDVQNLIDPLKHLQLEDPNSESGTSKH